MLILYVMVQDERTLGRSSVFQLLREADIDLLRCHMTLLMLPNNAAPILPDKRPFLHALRRVLEVPVPRFALAQQRPDEILWSEMIRQPLLVLMVTASRPIWLEELAEQRPLVLLSPHVPIVEYASRLAGVRVGLLQGTRDLRESYAALRSLCQLVADARRFDDRAHEILQRNAAQDLFASRSRLPFLDPMPLPDPAGGRAAAYLYNRLTDAVDDPGLFSDTPPGSAEYFYAALRFGLAASSALSCVETGQALPEHLRIDRAELEDLHARLAGADTSPTEKAGVFLGLGERVAAMMSTRHFLAIGVPRTDLIKGRVPPGAQLDPDARLHSAQGLAALRDLLAGTTRSRPEREPAKTQYERARGTLLSEERLLSCHTARLAAQCAAMPFQCRLASPAIRRAVNDLSNALEANSRKVPQMFRRVETLLSELVPMPWREALANEDSPVTCLSDLPLEWMILDEWPLCLTRPVARVPLGLARLDVLSAVVESKVTVDSRRPEGVLYLDLLAGTDPLRPHTDEFIAVSGALNQNYTYAAPATAREFRETVNRCQATIVVVDTHGSYDQETDTLRMGLGNGDASIDELVPEERVPPVWILSACDTSVTAAMRGCFVRQLLGHGAACVVATLSRVDGFIASMFVGRLLTEVFNPVARTGERTWAEVFFGTQLSTALLYDPLLPLIRRMAGDAALRESLASVFGDVFAWAGGIRMQPRTIRRDFAWILGAALHRAGLRDRQLQAERGGQVRPETLLFSCFGIPSRVFLIE